MLYTSIFTLEWILTYALKTCALYYSFQCFHHHLSIERNIETSIYRWYIRTPIHGTIELPQKVFNLYAKHKGYNVVFMRNLLPMTLALTDPQTMGRCGMFGMLVQFSLKEFFLKWQTTLNGKKILF